MSFLFVSRLGRAGRWRFVSSRSSSRFSSCVGVPFASFGLASRVGVSLVGSVSASCFSSRVVVSYLRPRVVGRIVSVLSCCAVFVSSFSRIVSSFLVVAVVLCVLFSSCVSDSVGSLWRCGEALRGHRGRRGVSVAMCVAVCDAGRRGGASSGSVMPCRVAWRVLRDEGTGRVARRRAGR